MRHIVATIFYYIVLLGVPTCGGIYGVKYDGKSGCEGFKCSLSFAIKFAWLLTMPFLVMSYLGLVMFPATCKRIYEPLADLQKDFAGTLIIRVVTRGTNPNLVRANVHKLKTVLIESMGEISWQIEIVTDKALDLSIDMVHEIVVPKDYKASNETLYKARALHYASQTSSTIGSDWVLHLDEESKIDERTLQGVMTHIIENNGEKAAIGQGVISYAPDDIQSVVHWITTLTDSMRVSNDYGVFRLQYQLFNTVYIGMKGSFVLVRNDLVSDVGWDNGYEGSITEDAFFAVLAKDKGYKFGYIDACVYELSPFSIMDLWKQRRRWMDGLWKVCLSSRLSICSKIPLFVTMVLWSVSWLALITIAVSIAIPSDVSLGLNIVYGVNTSFIILSYIIGFMMTRTPSEWIQTVGCCKYIWIGVCQLFGIPLFAVIEGTSVLYWLGSQIGSTCGQYKAGFDIVEKEKKEDIEYVANKADKVQPPC